LSVLAQDFLSAAIEPATGPLGPVSVTVSRVPSTTLTRAGCVGSVLVAAVAGVYVSVAACWTGAGAPPMTGAAPPAAIATAATASEPRTTTAAISRMRRIVIPDVSSGAWVAPRSG
jgi:hypothetical protein